MTELLNQPQTLDDLNGRTVTLGTLLDGINSSIGEDGKVYVPMYQRNYKWNRATAVKLADDLIDAYNNRASDNGNKFKSISLFTLYVCGNDIQIVDGQQRMITLMLIFHALRKSDKFVMLEFERDFHLLKKERINFISDLGSEEVFDKDKELTALSDKRRLYYNFEGIVERVKNISDADDFINFIREKIFLLLHITHDKPVSEFLNLNCNKTKFSICDRVRSALITYSDFNKDDFGKDKRIKIGTELGDSNYKRGVAKLIEELTGLMYNDDVYDVVKLGYAPDPDKTLENRMNIMFRDMLGADITDYTECSTEDVKDKEKLLLKLVYYRKLLRELAEDNITTTTRRAFINFFDQHHVKFFSLADKWLDKQTDLFEILNVEHSIDRLIIDYTQNKIKGGDDYFVNSYFEVLSKDNDDGKKGSSPLKDQFLNDKKEKSNFFTLKKESFEDIVQTSGKFILYRYINKKLEKKQSTEKHNEKEIDLDQVTEITPMENPPEDRSILVSGLLNKSIVIPVIQREYCMGSHFGKGDSDMLDHIIENCVADKEKEITLSAITVFYSADGKMHIYDGQQRTITLLCLLKLLGHKGSMPGVYFEHRDIFNKDLESFFENDVISPRSYSMRSIKNLKTKLNEKLKHAQIDKERLNEYILNKIKLDVITLNSELSSAEQFFVEINDGVQLVPYEIFKCKINDRCEAVCAGDRIRFNDWVSDIDNKWLDHFYRDIVSPKDDDESAAEELIEMRFIEFCSRMIYWEKHISDKNVKHSLDLRHFSDRGNDLGDMDPIINSLSEPEDIDLISKAVEHFLDATDGNNYVPQCITVDYGSGVWGENEKEIPVGFYHFDPVPLPGEADMFSTEDLVKGVKAKIKSNWKYEYYFDEHDVIFWAILRGKMNDEVKNLINCWNNQQINTSGFADVGKGHIGVWHYLCLTVPKHYCNINRIIEEYAKKLNIIEKDLKLKYDNVMTELCSVTHNIYPMVEWYGGKRFPENKKDLADEKIKPVESIVMDGKCIRLTKKYKILLLSVPCSRDGKKFGDSTAVLFINDQNVIEKIYATRGNQGFFADPWNGGRYIQLDLNKQLPFWVKYESNRTQFEYWIYITL